MKKRTLLTGGSGLLGSHLRTIDPSLIAPMQETMDIRSEESIRRCLAEEKPSIIIHCAAVTQTHYVNSNPAEAIMANIGGTAIIAASCAELGIRLIYISTDYLYADMPGPHHEDEPLQPCNLYAWTKLGGECAVKLVPDSLIIRTSFGPRPCQYAKAATDKFASKLYVDEVAPLILRLAESELRGVINVGGEPISIFDYAKRTNPNVRSTTIAEIGEPLARDTSMDLTRLKKFLSGL